MYDMFLGALGLVMVFGAGALVTWIQSKRKARELGLEIQKQSEKRDAEIDSKSIDELIKDRKRWIDTFKSKLK